MGNQSRNLRAGKEASSGLTTTKKRDWGAMTWLNKWTREATEFDSHLEHYSKNDVDVVWEGPSNGSPGTSEYMLIEEKSHWASVPQGQLIMIKRISDNLSRDPLFRGYHIVQYDVNPEKEDRIFIDGTATSFDPEFYEFLKFKSTWIPYTTPLTQLINGKKETWEYGESV